MRRICKTPVFDHQLTSTADLEVLASSTQILTSKPEELKSENITAATQIANTLLQSPNATEVKIKDLWKVRTWESSWLDCDVMCFRTPGQQPSLQSAS